MAHAIPIAMHRGVRNDPATNIAGMCCFAKWHQVELWNRPAKSTTMPLYACESTAIEAITSHLPTLQAPDKSALAGLLVRRRRRGGCRRRADPWKPASAPSAELAGSHRFNQNGLKVGRRRWALCLARSDVQECWRFRSVTSRTGDAPRKYAASTREPRIPA